MEIFNENMSKVDTNSVEINILGDFNISLWQNGHYVFQKHNFLSCLSVPNDVKNYFDFCTMFGLKQLIESPTRITCSSSSIIDHILASFPNWVTQREILNVRLSDHQLIYCTRKITRIKIISKVSARLRSLHRKNKYLTPNLCHLLRKGFNKSSFWLRLFSMVS